MPCLPASKFSEFSSAPYAFLKHTLGRTADTAAQSSGAGLSLVVKGNALSLAIEPAAELNEEEECGELEGA